MSIQMNIRTLANSFSDRHVVEVTDAGIRLESPHSNDEQDMCFFPTAHVDAADRIYQNPSRHDGTYHGLFILLVAGAMECRRAMLV